MAVIHDLHEVMALGRGECLQAPIIDEQQPDFGGLSQQFVVAAVGLGLGECKQQARQAVIVSLIHMSRVLNTRSLSFLFSGRQTSIGTRNS